MQRGRPLPGGSCTETHALLATLPSLTSVQVRSHELGAEAGRMLLRRLGSASGGSKLGGEHRVADMGFRMVTRESA